MTPKQFEGCLKATAPKRVSVPRVVGIEHGIFRSSKPHIECAMTMPDGERYNYFLIRSYNIPCDATTFELDKAGRRIEKDLRSYCKIAGEYNATIAGGS